MIDSPEPARPRAGDAAVTRWQWTIIAALIAGYAGLSYYSDANPDALNLAAALSFAPVVVIGLALVWRWTRPAIGALILVITCALLYRYWASIRVNYPWSNLLQQFAAYGLVAWGFARSLSAGLVPVCTQLADKLHGPLTPAELTYTRYATVAWAAFYALLAMTIVALFFVAPPRIWSLFVNFATFGLIGLMFLVEHSIRRRMLPHGRRGNTWAALRQVLIG